MDSDLACVNGKSARQSRCYADTFKRSTISGAIYHLPFGVYVRHCLKYTLLIDCVLTLTYLLYNVSMQTTETELNGDIWSSSLAAGGGLSSAGSLDTPNMRCLPSPPAQSSQCMLTVSLLICLHHMLSSCSMMSKETREPAIANRLLVTRSIWPWTTSFSWYLTCNEHVGSGCCRISSPRFLTECRKRQQNQGSFVLLCFVLFTFSELHLCIILFVSISQVICCEDHLWNDLDCVWWHVKVCSNCKKTSPLVLKSSECDDKSVNGKWCSTNWNWNSHWND